ERGFKCFTELVDIDGLHSWFLKSTSRVGDVDQHTSPISQRAGALQADQDIAHRRLDERYVIDLLGSSAFAFELAGFAEQGVTHVGTCLTEECADGEVDAEEGNGF